MKVVTFGELMLRLAPENYLRFVQSDKYEATFGGAEANVAVSLANYGVDAAFVSKLPAHERGTENFVSGAGRRIQHARHNQVSVLADDGEKPPRDICLHQPRRGILPRGDSGPGGVHQRGHLGHPRPDTRINHSYGKRKTRAALRKTAHHAFFQHCRTPCLRCIGGISRALAGVVSRQGAQK